MAKEDTDFIQMQRSNSQNDKENENPEKEGSSISSPDITNSPLNNIKQNITF